MTVERSPAFQFYPRDFISDSNVLAMTMPERGVYITLLCLCWTDGSLPSDLTRLARLIGLTAGQLQKMWPALGVCFKPHPDDVGRMIHPRLEKERMKQGDYRQRQSDNGRLGGRPKKPNESQTKPTENPPLSSGLSQTKAKKSSSSAICDLPSASAETKSGPALVDARSKRPIFRGQRFVVFEWMLDDLRKLLGTHVEAFDLHAWFFDLDAQAESAGVVVPQRDGGRWLQEQTLAEAVRRGLPVAEASRPGKTSGNAAAAARFVARGQAS